MKKILVAIVSIFSLTTYSQSSEAIYDVIAKETCECINKKNIDISKSSSKEIQAQLGMCMLTSYTAHKNELKPEDRVEFGDDSGMEKLGESVALKMIDHCPNVILELGGKVNDDAPKGEVKEKISGQFLESKSNDFVTISVKDESGRIYSLLLLTFFENSNLISDNLLKKNQKIEVEYAEQEFYDVKSKDFRLYKVLKGIKKL